MSMFAKLKKDAVASAVIASLVIGAVGYVAFTPKGGGYTQIDLAAKKCKKGNRQQRKKCRKKRSTITPRPPAPSPTATGATPAPTTSGAPTPAPTGSPGTGGGGPSSCATPYAPGEQGAEAEIAVVTPDHTEEAPLEVPLAVAMGLADAGPVVGVEDSYLNVQVDSPGETGLYVRVEFLPFEDLDMYLNYADGSEAAHVAGFNPVSAGPFGGTGDGGHSERGAEQLDGVRAPSCAGYTIAVHPYINEEAELTVLLWQGEPTFDPPPPGAGAAVMR